MKVITISLGCCFTEGMTYQDNLLANQLKKDGNEVIVITTCFKYKNGRLVITKEENKVLSNGIRIIRMKHKNILGDYISGKVRSVRGLYGILKTEKPDIIFHHSLQSYELYTVARYKKNNPSVKLFVDNHADFNNSATNILSKNILHKLFYKKIIDISLPYIDKVFCVSYESLLFAKDVYKIPDHKIEYYPLGGIILDDNERIRKRNKIREKLGLNSSDILIIHAGNMNKHKRTEEILKGFVQVTNKRLHLILIGSLSNDIQKNVENMLTLDKRIKFLGWMNEDELIEYLCASDIYIQLGSQSVIMQNAACCMCALALYPHPSHDYLLRDSVFYIKNAVDIVNLLENVVDNPKLIEQKRLQSYKIAMDKLDYRVLAKRLYE